MVDILTTVKAAASGMATIVKLSNEIKNLELQKQVAETNLLLVRTMNEATELQNENTQLKETIRILEYDRDHPLTFNKDDGFYYDENNECYCPACYDSKKLRSHIYKKYNECKVCGAEYGDSPMPVVAVANNNSGINWSGY